MVTWILTGSPENFAAMRTHGFTVIGLKEGRRSFAEPFERGDRIVFSRGLRPLTRLAPTPGHGPAEHRKLAFQGQIRRVGDADARLLADRLHAAAAAAAQPG